MSRRIWPRLSFATPSLVRQRSVGRSRPWQRSSKRCETVLPKPAECVGCPFYGDGKGFVPDEIYEAAPVYIVGQNPGEEEEAQGRPYVGKTGAIMDSKYLKLAALFRGEVSIGN